MDPQDDADKNKQNERDAAANVVRGQLDNLYDKNHASSDSGDDPSGHMQKYHNEWQKYYQNYYEQYYVGHLHKAIEEQEKAKRTPEEKQEEEVADLRQKITTKAKTSAKRARKSRHFVPIASALTVALIVGFLQYNRVLFASVEAYVSPGAIDPQNIVVDPTTNVKVGPEPRIVIPKINVNAPVYYNVGYDYSSMMAAMAKGVAHFGIPGANSVPGQVGNTVLSGHSSSDLFDTGEYKFIFVQLPKLEKGDTIYANYKSIRYTYTVTKMEVVRPNQVNKLTYATDKPVLTLITCVPIGTANKRLLVTAEQISPDPTKARPADTNSSNSDDAKMPDNGPTALERLFGAQ